MNALLIAGTDNGVGKTVLISALAAYWQRYCTDRLGILKPVQCGTGYSPDIYPQAERDLYRHLFSLDQSLEEINPCFFQAPLVPPLAAALENRRVELEPLWQAFERLAQDRSLVLVEGWGGLGSPLTSESTVADLAWDWRIPVVLVVPVSPGTIAQTVANAALAHQARVHLKGIVLNCIQPCHAPEQADWANLELIQSLTHKPVLGCIPHLTDPTDLNKLVQVASSLDLERLMPLH